MNKKNLWNLLSIMMIAILSIGFVSCSKDDDKSNNEGDNPTQETTSQQKLLGTWYVVWQSTELVEIQGYTFNADGTATGYEGKLRASDNYTPRGEQYACHYTFAGNTLSIREDGDGDTETYTVTFNEDGTMTLHKSNGKEEDVYTRLSNDKTPYQLLQEMAASYQK